jgi:kynurenine formamidase
VLFHTGWLAKLWEDTVLYLKKQPGLGVDGARYLIAKGVALVGIDARTIEASPFKYKEIAPVHQDAYYQKWYAYN